MPVQDSKTGDKVSVSRDMIYGRPVRLERSFQVRMGGGERSDPSPRDTLYPGKNKGRQQTRGLPGGVGQIRVIEKSIRQMKGHPSLSLIRYKSIF